jgi:hypothetical protein
MPEFRICQNGIPGGRIPDVAPPVSHLARGKQQPGNGTQESKESRKPDDAPEHAVKRMCKSRRSQPALKGADPEQDQRRAIVKNATKDERVVHTPPYCIDSKL